MVVVVLVVVVVVVVLLVIAAEAISCWGYIEHRTDAVVYNYSSANLDCCLANVY